MLGYLFRKIGYSLLVLLGIVTVIFFLFAVLPGDPARMMLGQRNDKESLEAIRRDLGLDKPVVIQYTKYLNDLMPLSFHSTNPMNFFYFDPLTYPAHFTLLTFTNSTVVIKVPYLRRSYQTRKPVSETISEVLPNTFILAVSSILFATFAGILLGISIANHPNTWYDKAMLFFASMGMSLPSFFAAILIGWLFAFVLGRYTGLNLTGNLYTIDDFGRGQYLELKNLILPTLTLGIRPLAIVMQLMRNSLLEVLSQDYIRTAYAKGLSSGRVIYRHALKNALNPVVTAISGWFASLMAGVVFIEYIFGWRGLGYIIVEALNTYDLPVVMGCVITISLIFVCVNIVVDILYAWLDPRVRS